jgi:hypothetical protein
MGLFQGTRRSRFPADMDRRLEDFDRPRIDSIRNRIAFAADRRDTFDIPAALALIEPGFR